MRVTEQIISIFLQKCVAKMQMTYDLFITIMPKYVCKKSSISCTNNVAILIFFRIIVICISYTTAY